MVAGYQAGRTMSGLAAEFGIDRRTVSTHLCRAEIATRRGGLDQQRAHETADLYEAGWSSGMLAEKFEMSADKVLKVLRQAGVAIRPWRGGPARLSRRRATLRCRYADAYRRPGSGGGESGTGPLWVRRTFSCGSVPACTPRRSRLASIDERFGDAAVTFLEARRVSAKDAPLTSREPAEALRACCEDVAAVQ